ncbi:MAG: hypothetical protein NC133_04660 [Prevotella sp.]|nr:hypothetical protein [Muribaculaceae bacterium]MCM1404756.1 hypothetical protein [Prevotella sp.]
MKYTKMLAMCTVIALTCTSRAVAGYVCAWYVGGGYTLEPELNNGDYGDNIATCYSDANGNNRVNAYSNSNYDAVCFTYDREVVDVIGHHLLYGCKVSGYGCRPKSYYDNDAGKCVNCPDGSFAQIRDGTTHLYSTCDYCLRGYYWDGTACVPCPDDGMMLPTGDVAVWQRAVTECFLAPGDHVDDTGAFIIAPPKNPPTDFCYYVK